MAPQDNRSRSDETSAETTAALPDDLDELHEPTSTSAEEAVPALEELPSGSALLLVTRGRNAGARFLLDRDFMAAGRHPDSDIFLDYSIVIPHRFGVDSVFLLVRDVYSGAVWWGGGRERLRGREPPHVYGRQEFRGLRVAARHG
ncbi:MAG: hypothetical protein ACLQLO_18950 [Mycobacterium sp.]